MKMYVYLVRNLLVLFAVLTMDLVAPSFNGLRLLRVVVIVSVETSYAVVTTNTFGSIEDRIIIREFYVKSHGVARVQEVVVSTREIEARIESLSYDFDDMGVSTESVDVGLCSSITDFM